MYYGPSVRAVSGHAVSESTSSTASSPAPAKPSDSPIAWASTTLHKAKNATPVSVKQLAHAARTGTLFRVAGIQANNAWMRFGAGIVAVGFAGVSYGAWQGVQKVAAFFVELRENYLSIAAVGSGAVLGLAAYGLYRHQFVVNPGQVHTLALRMLRGDPVIQGVMRLPLTSGQPVASMVTGGNVYFKWLVFPQWRSQRIQMTFPVRGADAAGVALVEAKKRWGRHKFRLLAVDVPSRAPLGPEERLYVRGGPDVAMSGTEAVLGVLRQPLQAAMTAEVRHEQDQDDADDDAEARAAASRRAAERAPKPLEEGGGMYAYERVYWQAYYGAKQLRKWFVSLPVRSVEP